MRGKRMEQSSVIQTVLEVLVPTILGGMLTMFTRPRLRLKWEAKEPFLCATSRLDWSNKIDGIALKMRVWNAGWPATGKECAVYLQEIKKNGAIIFNERAQLAWEDGNFGGRNLPSGKHRGRWVQVGLAEKTREYFQFRCQTPEKAKLGEPGEYMVVFCAESPAWWASAAELTMTFKYVPFSGQVEIVDVRSKPWYLKLL